MRNQLIGQVDEHQFGFIRGWVSYPDSTDSIEINLLVDGVLTGSVVANEFRADLLHGGLKHGYHGFSWPMPLDCYDGKQHTIQIRPKHQFDIVFAELMFTASPNAAIGCLESKTDKDLVGWIFFPRKRQEPVALDVWVDGELVKQVVADESRPDVSAKMDSDVRCGFRVQFADVLPPEGGRHKVEITPSGNGGLKFTTDVDTSANALFDDFRHAVQLESQGKTDEALSAQERLGNVFGDNLHFLRHQASCVRASVNNGDSKVVSDLLDALSSGRTFKEKPLFEAALIKHALSAKWMTVAGCILKHREKLRHNGTLALLHALSAKLATELKGVHSDDPGFVVRLTMVFDEVYYTEHYPDVALSSVEPLEHFLNHGLIEKRSPNEYFDANFYWSTYGDVAENGINPLFHYLSWGYLESRKVSNNFNVGWYFRKFMQHDEASQVLFSPLEHFLLKGRYEGASPTRKLTTQELFVTPAATPAPASLPAAIAVIVPVYRDVQITLNCLRSIIAAPSRTQIKLIVINDCSPEPDMAAQLQLAGEEWLRQRDRSSVSEFLLYRNEVNKGFVETANLGFALAEGLDLIILNSDTEVANDWVDRMLWHAYSRPEVGTVTPFSNNATICSFPHFPSGSELPEGLSVTEIDQVFATANRGRQLDLPTGHGFCMFIKRACLSETGVFDHERFHKGYGEETDFCVRAGNLGWKHIQAADVFVHHVGEVSFGADGAKQRSAAAEIMRSTHAQYEREVAYFVAADEGLPFRVTAAAELYRRSGKPCILIITHHLGGGIARHINDLEKRFGRAANFLILAPQANGLSIKTLAPFSGLEIALPSNMALDDLADLLRRFGVSRLHVHSLLHQPIDAPRFIRTTGLPYDVTIHDYFFVCPFLFLMSERGTYCGEPDAQGCNECLDRRHMFETNTIEAWRGAHKLLLDGAERVLCPSMDVMRRLSGYFPQARLVLASHDELIESDWTAQRVQHLLPHEKLRVAVIGHMALHKGQQLLLDTCREIDRKGIDAKVVVFGTLEAGDSESLEVRGEFKEGHLPALLDGFRPHVAWFPSQVPETYSYALNHALARGLPVISPNIGAFPERMVGTLLSWQVPVAASAQEMAGLIDRIRDVFLNSPANEGGAPLRLASNFYSTYLSPPSVEETPRQAPVKLAPHLRRRLNVAAVPSRLRPTLIDACGFIRMVRPLNHPPFQHRISSQFLPAEAAMDVVSDILWLQRNALRNLEQAERVMARARRIGMKVGFDLDDDLPAMETSHIDAAEHDKTRDALLYVIDSCDFMTVSTEVLLDRYRARCRNIHLVPNALDENLWRKDITQPEITSGNPIRILYMGTLTHAADLDMIAPALQHVLANAPGRVAFDMIGVSNNFKRYPWLNMVELPPGIATSYPRFVKWLQSQNRWHIGVAPLVNNHFNRAKSHLKYLEYAALGMAPVVSKLAPYDHIIDHNINGLKVLGAAEQWTETMSSLVARPEQIMSLGLQAQKFVHREWTLHSKAGILYDALVSA